MRYTTDVVIEGVQAMTPAPVFRVSGSFVSAARPVSGQECFGSAAAVQQVKSVSGTGLAGAAGVLGLVALDAGLLERHGYAGLSGLERLRLVTQPVPARIQAQLSDSDSSDDDTSDDESKGDNGSKPMTPWDFRTSSPPG